MTAPGLPPLQWDVFCQVIDNYGDIGVCWRLASQLAARGQRVRLWVDDASALAWMAPAGCPGVELRPWGGAVPTAHEAAPGVLVEAFGCEIPEPFLAWAVERAQDRQPVWINLEYLSAEGYVERNHRLPSLIMSGPARGWTRWFFYPGFTPATGGLLREPGLLDQRPPGFAAAWRAGQPPATQQPERWMSLFCYEPAALPALLAQAMQPGAIPTRLLVTPGRATQAVQSALATLPAEHGPLQLQFLAPTDQQGFDDLLRASDFNAVRGEDSLVRALWAGRALVWHIYPQHDGAHHAKLAAFLDWLQAPATLRDFHAAWNGITGHGPLTIPDDETLAGWTACIQAARARLMQQTDLVGQLVGFIAEKR
ncbi:elongation factor P maturation arginine rhamnosyltransferase EarP [Acidovorax sp. A1169]|uniref:elongation factor P maturation arginine rhamnosyltransferase EarP n=1 Tax=Acidovorax sp. A1169 TaxID=3059524 RepID=UPI002737D586|nr:elongation factor P maturation arginine rhamnosyltransferase EarP [Acidovorax sp. A1169]MDP4078888.1 elongation factor P maturation arginine rhamnosyltransferase EarP [Acidovorax sp. A1169]